MKQGHKRGLRRAIEHEGFGRRLSEMRVVSGMSTREIGEMSGSHWANIPHYESGKVPPPHAELVVRLANAMGYPEDHPETQGLLKAALIERVLAVEEEYGQYIIEWGD